jgi:hypothetical protein
MVETKPLERSEFFKFLMAGINLLASQRAEPLHTEALVTKAAHHRTIYQGASEFVRAHVFGSQVDSGVLAQASHETNGSGCALASSRKLISA